MASDSCSKFGVLYNNCYFCMTAIPGTGCQHLSVMGVFWSEISAVAVN